MTGIADIRAAVIGTGLHRHGPRRVAPPHRRPGPRRPRQHPGARRSTRRALGVGHALSSLDAILDDPPSTSCT